MGQTRPKPKPYIQIRIDTTSSNYMRQTTRQPCWGPKVIY